MDLKYTKMLISTSRWMKCNVVLLVFALITLFGYGCVAADQDPLNQEEAISPAPDYSQDFSWVSKPGVCEKPVDVFYVYPTIYDGQSPLNMDIRDHDLRFDAQHLVDIQASVYSESANIFAPYYRQMSFAVLDPEEDMFQNEYFRIGYEDVSRAFEYYLKHFNNGRPFILAGHSQGSMALIILMREHFKNPNLQKQLVAAYLIGYSVTSQDFKNYPWMKPATQAIDIGVIISYNTQAPETTGSPVLLPGAYCINPLNWATDEIPADKSLNLGAVFFSDTNSSIEREVVNYTGACVDKKTGALVTTPPDELDGGAFPPGVYHKYDYAFWYRNIEKNVNARCKNYFEQNRK